MAKSEKNPWDDVPEPTDGLPGGILYDLTISDAEATYTKTEPQRRMFRVEYTVDAPKDFKGQKHTEYFTIGNEDDTEGTDPEQLKKSFGAKAFKKMATAAGVKMLKDPDDMAEQLKDEKVSGIITERTDKNGDKRSGVRPTNWFAVGENEPGEVASGSKGTKAKRRKDDDEDEKPAKKPAKKPAAKDDDDDEEEAEEKPAKKPKKPAKDEDEEEEEDTDEDESDDDDDDDDDPKARRRRR